MIKSWKDKWIKALRSGKYLQGDNWFKKTVNNNIDLYCSMGVLLAIDKNTKWKHKGENCFVPDHGLTSSTSYLKNKYGLPIDMYDKLVFLNDAELQNFNYIADYIEQNL